MSSNLDRIINRSYFCVHFIIPNLLYFNFDSHLLGIKYSLFVYTLLCQIAKSLILIVIYMGFYLILLITYFWVFKIIIFHSIWNQVLMKLCLIFVLKWNENWECDFDSMFRCQWWIFLPWNISSSSWMMMWNPCFEPPLLHHLFVWVLWEFEHDSREQLEATYANILIVYEFD